MGAKQQTLAAADDPLVEAIVFRGTVQSPEGEFGPGATIKVPASEAARLKRLGVVKPDDYEAPEEVQDGKLRMSSEDGPQVHQRALA